uniref:23S rRNA (Uracil-5-)-methyltransferase RumA n=1 Tax=uncultured bacterium 89 TaxID=698393 RepID=E3T694_9BACT|nr:23S rRNA (uracil-5-)-methyltransferase RumA [uncultured bacterium 89]
MGSAGTNTEPFEIEIEKLVYGGDGLARRDGEVIFVSHVLTGERVQVEAVDGRPGMLRARLLRVIEPAPERVPPPCPYFARCGGCHYQHAGYEAQLSAKRAILIETLTRVGKFQPPEDIHIVSAEPWGYRNRTQLHIAGTGIGYLEERSHKLCPVDRCPISSPRINQAIGTLVAMVRDSRWPRFVRSIELFTNETGLQLNVLESSRPVARHFFEWCAEQLGSTVSGPIEYPSGGALYRVSHKSFFQVNRFLADQLVSLALEGTEGETAADLYAGVGLFSIPLRKRFAQVNAVESSGSAVRDLIFNAERAEVAVETYQQPSAAYLHNLAAAPDFVLADPPRAGLGKDVVMELARLQPRKITIVACDPATLARDLAGLLAAGYKINGVEMVDLFPQTFHIETIVHLSL